MVARYYDGNVGRFVSQDPLYLAFGDDKAVKAKVGRDFQQFLEDPQAFNRYAYARNSPLVYIDSTGESFRINIFGFLPQSTQDAMDVSYVMDQHTELTFY